MVINPVVSLIHFTAGSDNGWLNVQQKKKQTKKKKNQNSDGHGKKNFVWKICPVNKGLGKSHEDFRSFAQRPKTCLNYDDP
jgi:hypothetical protein